MLSWIGFVKLFNIFFILKDYSISYGDEELIYGD